MPFNMPSEAGQTSQLQFHLLPTISYRSRLLIAAILIGLGLLLQGWLAFRGINGALGLSFILLFGGNLFLLIRGYNSKPRRMARKTTWEAATLESFRRIPALEKSVQKWDDTAFDISCVPGFFALVALIALFVAAIAFLGQTMPHAPWAGIMAIDAALLIIPHWVTGLRRGWRPAVLCQQAKALQSVIDMASPRLERWGEIVPMLEMAPAEPKPVPVGARLMVRFPKASSDFIGIQFQVNLNNVQGTNYPYLYAVIVAKKGFHLLLLKRLQQVRAAAPKLAVETDDAGEVDVIIIRQQTTKNSGYHTNKSAVARIVECTLTAAESILGESPSAL